MTVKIICDPFESNPVDWSEWYTDLKKAAYMNQGGKCICGEPLKGYGQLHHALISRADVKGLSETYQMMILHHSFNVILCHPECHGGLQREKCLEYLSGLYGREKIEAWYDDLPFKILPRLLKGFSYE